MPSGSNVEFREIPIRQIQPNGYNPNRMSPGQFQALKRTIQKDGFVGAALVNQLPQGFVLIDGEHRWRAAQELGLREIPCAVINLPPERARALTIKLNQIHGEWIPDLLVDVVSGLNEPLAELGFPEGELERLLSQLNDIDDLDSVESGAISRRSLDPGGTASERYIGFNLTPQRRELLEQALSLAAPRNPDRENPRAGSLEVILRSFIVESAATA